MNQTFRIAMLLLILSSAESFAQPSDNDAERSFIDPDETAASEFIREIREAAPPPPPDQEPE